MGIDSCVFTNAKIYNYVHISNTIYIYDSIFINSK